MVGSELPFLSEKHNRPIIHEDLDTYTIISNQKPLKTLQKQSSWEGLDRIGFEKKTRKWRGIPAEKSQLVRPGRE
jgi:hypothetical protein